MRVLLALAALLAGVSASSQDLEVHEVARAAADAPGRALRTGKCCNRAAKLKRKQIVFRQKWRECEAASTPTESEPAAECDNEQLAAENDQLTAENEELAAVNVQLYADKDQLLGRSEKLLVEKEQLLGEKEQLLGEKEQLTADKEQLTADKEQLTESLAACTLEKAVEVHYGVTLECAQELYCPYGRMHCHMGPSFQFDGFEANDFMSFQFEFEDAVGSGKITAPCPGQFVGTAVCTQFQQTYTCYGAKCGSLWYAGSEDCNDFVCTAEDIKCVMFRGSGTCQAGTICTMDQGTLTCEEGASCTGGDTEMTCETGSGCTGSAGTGDAHTTMNCATGTSCTGSAGTGDARTTMNCAAGSTCSCRASNGRAQCIMNCEEGATCTCERGISNSACVWN